MLSTSYLVSHTGQRPRSMTDELLERFPAELRAGTSIAKACALCGISQQTYYRWRAEAEADECNEWQRKFVALVDEAEAHYVASIEKVVADTSRQGRVRKIYKYRRIMDERGNVTVRRDLDTEIIESDPTTSLRVLERRHPDQWARKSRVELSGPGGGPIESLNAHVVLPPEAYEQLSIELRRKLLAEYEEHKSLTAETQLMLSLEMRQRGIELALPATAPSCTLITRIVLE